MPNENLVETRVAYKDYDSIEESTRRKRDKFKLAGKAIAEIGVYNFFIINSSNASLIKAITVQIKREDWENRNDGELDHEFSYIDISDCIQLSTDQLIERRQNPRNGFPPIAKLCLMKFNKLCKVARDLRNPTVATRVPREVRKYICSALDVSDELKRKLGF